MDKEGKGAVMDTITYKIAEIGDVVGGGTPSTSNPDLWGGEIPWISPKDLTGYNSIYISHGENFLTPKGLKSGTKLLPKDTVLFSSRAPIGYIAIASNPICTNQGFKSIICNKDLITPLFLYYYIKANLDYIKLFGTGATFPEISGAAMKKIKIQIPSLPIQQKIASILSTYDTLIENNNRRIRLLEQMAENLYKEWFVRFRFPGHEKLENGLPKEWTIKRVKDCVERLPFGRTYKVKELYKEGKVIVVDQSTSDYLGYHNDVPAHYASFESPIILFGDHSCKFYLMTRDFSLGENIIPFKSKDKNQVNEYYLFFATHNLIKTEEYKRHWGRFSSMKIVIPKIELQQKFNKLIREYEKMKRYMYSQNTLLTRQRDLLLPRLMSGKLEVKP